MAIPKRKYREILFQILFSRDFGGSHDIKDMSSILDVIMTTKKNIDLICKKVDEIASKIDKLDEYISRFSYEYSIDRISKAELNILRIGIFELLYEENPLPYKVVVSELIRITKKFGTREGASYINAVIDVIYKKGIGVDRK